YGDRGLRGLGPTRPTRVASYSVSVRQVAALLPRFFQTSPRGDRPCASLALCLTRLGQRTYTSKLSNMLGTPEIRGRSRTCRIRPTCRGDAISRAVEQFADAAVFWPVFSDLTKSKITRLSDSVQEVLRPREAPLGLVGAPRGGDRRRIFAGPNLRESRCRSEQ